MTNIENLFPAEGAPVVDRKKYPPNKISDIVDSFFVDEINGKISPKSPPPNRDEAQVKILLGAPGSGKSYNAAEDYFALNRTVQSKTVYVSYDETGAIYAIPEFVKEMKEILGNDFDEHGHIDFDALEPEEYQAIEGIWTKYRALSQHIRSEILNRAAADGFNLIIDTTSSSPGSLKMIKAFKGAGYKKENIEIEGTYAPWDMSRSRVETRPRKASYLELLTKRVGNPEDNKGALNMIRPLIEAAGTFTYRYNPDNQNAPQVAFAYKDGELAEANLDVIDQMQQSCEHDVLRMIGFLPEIVEKHPDFQKDAADYERYIYQTDDGFRAFLEQVKLAMRPAPDPKSGSAPPAAPEP